MDADNELAKAKWLMLSVVMFLVSACLSYGELMYLLAGHDAKADVTKAYESTSRGRFGTPRDTRLTVDFAFTEPDGTRRTGTDTVSLDWPPPVGNKVPVRYTPGAEGRARLAGHVHWVGLTLFGLSVAAMTVFGVVLWREANDEPGRRKGAKRGR